ncbi:2-O-methyltransferase NoeI [bacterium HR37]|nr:2-O-methyltransferase NoeI [bacterium HR37]
MTLFHSLLKAYRSSVKRIPGVHKSVYFISQHVVLPLLENWRQFWTVPDDPINLRFAFLMQAYEPETVAFFRKHVRPGMVVVDIGANVGYYTRLFSDLVGPSGLVIAFEPHPVNLMFLEKNLRNRANVNLIPKAVGSERGIAKIYDSPVASGGASLHWFDQKWKFVKSRNVKEIAPRLNREEIRIWEVEVVKIDDMLHELGVSKVDLVKIDIEGAEVVALQGAKQILSYSGALIVFELAPTNLREFGYTSVDLIEVLQSCGYKEFGVLSDKGVVEILTSQKFTELSIKLGLEVDSYVNCVASKMEFT